MEPDSSQGYLVKGKRQRLQPEIQKILLNIRKNFFTVRAVKQWKRLPGEVGASPLLKIFKTHLDMVLGSLLWLMLL